MLTLLGNKMAESIATKTGPPSLPTVVAKSPKSPATPVKRPPSPADENGAKSVPLHCIVENVRDNPHDPPLVEMDTYAILPGSTLFCQVVRTALSKIGYTASEAIGAKGTVQFKHWKPLAFETITENPDATLDEILGDLISVSTLKIRLCSKSKMFAVDDVREKLQTFLVKNSVGILSSAGCPIEQSVLSQLTHGDYSAVSLSEDVCSTFNSWYNQHSQTKSETGRASPSTREVETQNGGSSLPPGVITVQPEETRPFYLPPHASRPRLRTQFDPEQEIPRLQQWFRDNPHPSRETMLTYLDQLNSLSFRQGSNKALELTNIAYWFKNTRAAQRRANKSGTQSGSNSGNDSGADNEGELDLSMDSERSFSPAGSERVTREAVSSPNPAVPELPNRNAVYVVNPMYPLSPAAHHRVEVVNVNEEKEDHEEDEEDRLRRDEEEDMDDSPSPGSSVGHLGSASSLTHHSPHHHHTTHHHHNNRPVVNIKPSTNNNKHLENGDVESSDQAEDLSMRRPSSDSSTHSLDFSKKKSSTASSSGDSLAAADYLAGLSKTPSPKSLMGSPTSSSSLGQHYDQMRHHQALQMAAMSLNMAHYMHPAALYPPLHSSHAAAAAAAAHSAANAATSPSPFSLKDPNHNHPAVVSSAGGITGHQSSLASLDSLTSPVGLSSDDRKKRSRVFIDPLTEIPKLEKWFMEDTHPSSYMIEKFTEELNRSSYRQRFPKLEPKNVQLWFKNHRAKVKRTRLEQQALSQAQLNALGSSYTGNQSAQVSSS